MSFNLGAITNINGKQSASGIASGIDIQSLLEGALADKEKPIEKLQDKIDLNSKKIGALRSLKNTLNTLKESANALRNSTNLHDSQVNVFKHREITTSNTDDEGSPPDYLEVYADPGAQENSYKIEILQIATAKSLKIMPDAMNPGFATRDQSITTADGADDSFKAGTFSINDEEFSLEVGDSLQDIVHKINMKSNNTGTRAEIIKVSDNDFRLYVRSTSTGEDNAFNLDDPDGVLDSLTQQEQPAQNAQVKINDDEIERQSNLIDDVITNVTFKLFKPNNDDKSITFEIGKSVTSAQEGIKGFVANHNNLMQFLAKQQEKENENKYKEDAVLAKHPLVTKIQTRLSSFYTSTVNGIGDINNLPKIGLSMLNFEGDVSKDQLPTSFALNYNIIDLNAQLEKNFDNVSAIFGTQFTASKNTIRPNELPTNLENHDFTIHINPNGLEPPLDPTEKIAFLYDDEIIYGNFEQKEYGAIITGKPNTAFDGVKFDYIGDASANEDVIDIHVTQGIAEPTFRFLDNLTKLEGEIDQEIARLSKNNKYNTDKIQTLEQERNNFQNREMKKYAIMERTIAQLKQSMQYLETTIAMQTKKE